MKYKEHEHEILGVAGRMFARHRWPVDPKIPERSHGLFSSQTWKALREFSVGKSRRRIVVELRFDDSCKNGHSSFAITGVISGKQGLETAGCIHEDIAEWFPELAPLIKWHGTSTDGPMHYIANTVYLAGDRDHNGLRAGEVRQIRNGRTGELAWIRKAPGTEYFDGDVPPADSVTLKWEPWTRTGEGKARELDAARSAAVWPEATDEELSQEPEALKAALLARAPALLAAFRADMERIGFEWDAS